MKPRGLPLVILLVLTCFSATAQDSTRIDKLIAFPDKLFGALDKKARVFEANLNHKTNKFIQKLQKQEGRLKKKLYKKDSLLAKQLFEGVDSQYNRIKTAPSYGSKFSQTYSGHLDSLSTALNFLKGNNLSSSPELQKVLKGFSSMQEKLNGTDQIKSFIKGRQGQLREQLSKMGMLKELKKYNKQAYYYAAQVREYRAMFNDPGRLEQKLLETLVKLPQFKEFFARNSQLGSLFSLPGSSPASSVATAGLQTRASVNAILQDRFGSGVNTSQLLQQNTGAARGQLQELKDKAAKYKSGSFGNNTEDIEQPDFKPNNQKTKSLVKRLEYGGNIQSQKGRNFFPTTSDIAVTLGYKLNDKSVVGFGGSYKLGLGRGWNNLTLSHQGIGLRSYIDYKIKGSIFLAGGYEQNYRTLFNSIEQLRNYSAWQSSGLIGLSKKYNISKKLRGNMQVLWDFLSYQQVPKTQAVLFRVGYSFK